MTRDEAKARTAEVFAVFAPGVPYEWNGKPYQGGIAQVVEVGLPSVETAIYGSIEPNGKFLISVFDGEESVDIYQGTVTD